MQIFVFFVNIFISLFSFLLAACRAMNVYSAIVILIIINSKFLLSQAQISEVYPNLPFVDYFDVHFINPDTGFAVGEDGAIIRTTNGGKKWIRLIPPVASDFYFVRNFSSDNIIVGGSSGAILKSTNSGKTWVEVYQDSSISNKFYSAKILNANVAWVCGTGGKLLVTEDAGNTWRRVELNIMGTGFEIDFFDEKIGYLCNMSGFFVTEDSGKTWMNKGYGGFSTVEPIDDSIVVCGALDGNIAYSENRGTSWTIINVGAANNINSIEMTNDSIGYACKYSLSGYFKTTDGGKNWIYMGEKRIGNNKIFFVNDSIGYGVGIDLTLTKTTDGGKNWKRLIINEGNHAIFFVNHLDGFMSGNFNFAFESNHLYKTNDAGDTWEQYGNFDSLFNSADRRISKIYFIDSATGFIGDIVGRILKTTDKGKNWQYVDTNTSEAGRVQKFFFIDNRGWTLVAGSGIGRGGLVKKTTNGGNQWFIAADSIGNQFGNLSSVYFIDSLIGWIVGDNYFASSKDGGITWKKDSSFANQNISDIFFLDEQNGWINFHPGSTFKTTNGGITWDSTQLKGGTFIILNSNNFYIASKHGLFYSSDKGKNWLIRADTNTFISTIPKLNYGWGTGINNKIYRYLDNVTTKFDNEHNDFQNIKHELKIYPLPSNSQITFSYKMFEDNYVKIDIYNLLGEKIIGGNQTFNTTGTYKLHYDFKNLTSGIYVLLLTMNNLRSQQKIHSKKFLIIK